MTEELNYVQGDFLLNAAKIPATARRRKERTVISRGETGSLQQIKDVAGIFEDGSDIYIQVDEPRMLTHDEHRPLQIQPGTYRVGRTEDNDASDKVFAHPPPKQGARRISPED